MKLEPLLAAKEKGMELKLEIDFEFKKGERGETRQLTVKNKKNKEMLTLFADNLQNSLLINRELASSMKIIRYLELFTVQLSFWETYCKSLQIHIIEMNDSLRLFADPKFLDSFKEKFMPDKTIIPSKDKIYHYLELKPGAINTIDEIYLSVQETSNEFKAKEETLTIYPRYTFGRINASGYKDSYSSLKFHVSLFGFGRYITILVSHNEHLTLIDWETETRTRFKKENLRLELANYLNKIYRKNRLPSLFS